MSQKTAVTLLEVAPRDGFQSIAEPLPTTEKIAVIEMLLDAGVTRMELGSFVSPKAIPQMADMAKIAAHFRGREGVRLSVLVPNAKGASLALDAGYGDLVFVVSVSGAPQSEQCPADRRPVARSASRDRLAIRRRRRGDPGRSRHRLRLPLRRNCSARRSAPRLRRGAEDRAEGGIRALRHDRSCRSANGRQAFRDGHGRGADRNGLGLPRARHLRHGRRQCAVCAFGRECPSSKARQRVSAAAPSRRARPAIRPRKTCTSPSRRAGSRQASIGRSFWRRRTASRRCRAARRPAISASCRASGHFRNGCVRGCRRQTAATDGLDRGRRSPGAIVSALPRPSGKMAAMTQAERPAPLPEGFTSSRCLPGRSGRAGSGRSSRRSCGSR